MPKPAHKTQGQIRDMVLPKKKWSKWLKFAGGALLLVAFGIQMNQNREAAVVARRQLPRKALRLRNSRADATYTRSNTRISIFHRGSPELPSRNTSNSPLRNISTAEWG